jgi:hypothetical protein
VAAKCLTAYLVTGKYSYSGTKFCSSVLETDGIRVPVRNIRNLLCSLALHCHCPVRRASVTNTLCKSVDIFKICFNLNHIKLY